MTALTSRSWRAVCQGFESGVWLLVTTSSLCFYHYWPVATALLCWPLLGCPSPHLFPGGWFIKVALIFTRGPGDTRDWMESICPLTSPHGKTLDSISPPLWLCGGVELENSWDLVHFPRPCSASELRFFLGMRQWRFLALWFSTSPTDLTPKGQDTE